MQKRGHTKYLTSPIRLHKNVPGAVFPQKWIIYRLNVKWLAQINAMSSKITVVGSINVDLVIASDRLPLPGETIRGSRFQWIAGGKGADQAVAAAHQGVSISFVVAQATTSSAATRKRIWQTTRSMSSAFQR